MVIYTYIILVPNRFMVVSWVSRAVHSLVMAAKYNVVFVLGGPGAGKGTQCAKIVEVRMY